MTSSPAEPPQLFSTGDIAQLLSIPLRQLTWWFYGFRADRRYQEFELVRRNSPEPRIIRAPIKPIKEIQRKLATILIGCYDAPAHVHGFALGRSPTSNAAQHQRQHWLLRADLADFFPSINFGRVRGMFMAFPFEYPHTVATLLAHICCHANELPQGAPTSPIISNFICRRLDSQLAALARSERCRFTRYADDICFSTDRRSFPNSVGAQTVTGGSEVGPELLTIVETNGFSFNPDKTRLIRNSQRQRVTGLVVNGKVNTPREYVRSLRNLLYIWHKYGEDEATSALARHEPQRNRPPGREAPAFRHVMKGRVQYVGSIKGWNSSVYKELVRELQALDDTFQPRALVQLQSPQIVRIYTEGESDPLHLVAALRHFHERGKFPNLRIEVPDDAAAGGDSDLLIHCNGLALTPQPGPCVCVFDRDDDTTMRKATDGSDFKGYKNGVAAALIVAPDWRPGPRICIEMLYTDADLQRRDVNGRRLYLSEEFDPETGQHHTEPVHVPYRDKKALVREEVFAFDGGKSVGLGKLAFAKAVHEQQRGFEGVEFEGFRKTLQILQDAAAFAINRRP